MAPGRQAGQQRILLQQDLEKFGLSSPLNVRVGDMPIYYINLDRSRERREAMDAQLRALGLSNYERVAAVDGSALASWHGGSMGDGLYFTNDFSQDGSTIGELGCTLSHLKTLASIDLTKTHKQVALILEDDASFELVPRWPESLRELLATAPDDWEIIKLHHNEELWQARSSESARFVRHESNDPTYGAVAYLVNARGCAAVRRYGFSLNPSRCSQIQADRYIYALAITYDYHLPLFVTLDNDSEIHEDHRAGHAAQHALVLQRYDELHSQPTMEAPLKALRFARALHTMADYLEARGIPYSLTCGTLLSAYREDAFMEHDMDIDLLIDARFQGEIGNGSPELRLSSVYRRHGQTYELSFMGPGEISIDIFFVQRSEDGGLWVATFHALCDEATDTMCRWDLPADAFALTTLNFAGRAFPIPKAPEKMLEAWYGPLWFQTRKFTYHEGFETNIYNLKLTDFAPKRRRYLEKARARHLESDERSELLRLWPRQVITSPRPILWLYWTGMAMPAYIDLCVQSIRKHCSGLFEVLLLTDADFENLSRTRSPHFRQIQPLAMRADYVRSTLLHEFGGVWIDCDTIVMSPPHFLISAMQNYDLTVFNQHGDHEYDITIALVAARRGNLYCRRMKAIFEDETETGSKSKGQSTDIPWGLPTDRCVSFLREYRLHAPRAVSLDSRSIGLVSWHDSYAYFWSKGSVPREVLNGSMPCVRLHNHMYSDHERALSAREVLDGPWRVSQLLRHALARY